MRVFKLKTLRKLNDWKWDYICIPSHPIDDKTYAICINTNQTPWHIHFADKDEPIWRTWIDYIELDPDSSEYKLVILAIL